MSYSSSPSEAQERHGEFQVILNNKRKDYAESIAAVRILEEKIDKTAELSHEQQEELRNELQLLQNQRDILKQELESAEKEAEKLYYVWLLSIWKNRPVDRKRVVEIIQDIEIAMSNHEKSAQGIPPNEQQLSRECLLLRVQNLKHFHTQFTQLLDRKPDS